MSDGSQDIARRLRDLAGKYGGPAKLAKLLGRSPQMLNSYLSGQRIPGNKFRQLLRDKLGEEVEFYVMYGSNESIEMKRRVAVREEYRLYFKEESRMLDVIEKHGIQSAEQLDYILAARNMLLNEPKPRYKTKGAKK